MISRNLNCKSPLSLSWIFQLIGCCNHYASWLKVVFGTQFLMVSLHTINTCNTVCFHDILLYHIWLKKIPLVCLSAKMSNFLFFSLSLSCSSFGCVEDPWSSSLALMLAMCSVRSLPTTSLLEPTMSTKTTNVSQKSGWTSIRIFTTEYLQESLKQIQEISLNVWLSGRSWTVSRLSGT